MRPEAVVAELEGLRALARSLVRGDADAEDLLQDSAIAVIEHPPAEDGRPVGAWLRSLVRNRWRMDLRSAARRQAREQAALELPGDGGPADTIDRVRDLERLAAALVALAEPFRTTVTRRYLDGQSAAAIARALGVPAGTVRWRLKTGLARLREALAPPPRRAWLVLAGAGAMLKSKPAGIVAVLVVLAIVALWLARGLAVAPAPRRPVLASAPPRALVPPAPPPPALRAVARPKARGEPALAGRVVSWETGEGVPGAELTFTGDAGAITVRAEDDGSFELAPTALGTLALTAIAAPRYLPYAPELQHSSVRVTVARDRAVRGLILYLTPAVDYRGKVIDEHGAVVAGARVRVLGTPTGEQAIDQADTEWISDAQGAFTFHAVDGAVLEATSGEARGWGVVNGGVTNTHALTIGLGRAPALSATITGRVVDAAGAPIGDALVRATTTTIQVPWQATGFATTDDDGRFTLRQLDRGNYDLAIEAEDHAPARIEHVTGGSRDVAITLDAGLALAGRVVDPGGAPVPAFTLLVHRRTGAARELVVERSLIDPAGRFALRVPRGDYELTVSAAGWAPNAREVVAAGTTGLRLAVRAGATLRGQVIGDDHLPVAYARVMRDAATGGASVSPANAGTITRGDGTFELTGLPAGPVAIWLAADGYHPRIEGGMAVIDGGALGPITFQLSRLADGESPYVEQVGIGIHMAPDGDRMRVGSMVPGGSAELGGVAIGDLVTAIDGEPVSALGLEGVRARLRGALGTAVTLTVLRAGKPSELVLIRRKFRG